MSRNNALPDPDILMGLGEAFAAGYFELPDASPLRRWARAVRRRFEHRAIPAYAGTRLYPAGAHTQARENLLLSPSYSFTWSYNAAALQTCLATADERTRETIHLVENYPCEPLDRPLVSLIVRAAFQMLPDWALDMLERPRSCALEQAAVRAALQGMGASLAWAFADTGVAARARQRMRSVQGVTAAEPSPGT